MKNSITILISSGNGPGECRQAVAHVLRQLSKEAQSAGLVIDVAEEHALHGPKSVIVRLHSEGARELADNWIGTIQWSCKSKLRPGHRRQNWFSGVFELPEPVPNIQLSIDDIRFETFRAGGPGGQHQNTTDSAVRATCTRTGLSVVARERRSQHRNKASAIERLQMLIHAREEFDGAQRKQKLNLLHHQLERGNPIRRFKGDAFKEIRK